MRHLYRFYVSLRAQILDPFQRYQILVIPEQELVLIQNFELKVFQFYLHCYTTWYQLNFTTYSLPFRLQNKFKLLIMIPKIKAPLEEGQKLYTKNTTAQGLFLIQRWYGYHTI